MARCRRLPLDVSGLMAVGPAGDIEGSRRCFRWLAERARQLGLRELSMGMSDDFEVAIAEGRDHAPPGTGHLRSPTRAGGGATIGSRYWEASMASGILHKAMVYLGLTDDEYEDYDYEDTAPPPGPAAATPSLRTPPGRSQPSGP